MGILNDVPEIRRRLGEHFGPNSRIKPERVEVVLSIKTHHQTLEFLGAGIGICDCCHSAGVIPADEVDPKKIVRKQHPDWFRAADPNMPFPTWDAEFHPDHKADIVAAVKDILAAKANRVVALFRAGDGANYAACVECLELAIQVTEAVAQAAIVPEPAPEKPEILADVPIGTAVPATDEAVVTHAAGLTVGGTVADILDRELGPSDATEADEQPPDESNDDEEPDPTTLLDQTSAPGPRRKGRR